MVRHQQQHQPLLTTSSSLPHAQSHVTLVHGVGGGGSSSFGGSELRVLNYSDQGLTAVPETVMQALAERTANGLNLSHNQLDEVQHKLAAPLAERLLLLDVSFNEIRHLGRGGHVFSNLTHLRHLILSGNHVKTLFAGVFRGLKRLEVLEMRDGELAYMDEHAFDGLENLRLLDLSCNQIASIYLELFQSIANLHVSHPSQPACLPASRAASSCSRSCS